jgi:hypothetical protein
MKRTILLFMTSVAILYSCDKLSFNIDNTFKVSADVNLDANDDLTYSGNVTIDAASDQEVANNLSNISSYTVNSIDFSISDFELGSDSTTSTFSVSFYSGGSQIGSTISSQDPLPLPQLSASGQKINLPIDAATITAIQNALLSNNQVTIEYEGTVSEVPVKFTVNFFLDVTIGVQP